MTCSRVTPCRVIRFWSAWTWSMSRRSPQIGTLATPGTRSNRERTFQYAVIDRSIMSISGSLLDSPIFRTRLVADIGCSITGGAAQVGSVGVMLAMRSCTSWRASSRSVSCSNSSTICDSCSTDLERISEMPGTPLRDCSSGTVMSDSTSVGASPMATVWISTLGGANSGNTSTGASSIRCTPKKSRAAASATTMNRNFRLAPTIQRMVSLLVLRRSVSDLGLDAVQLGHADGHDLGPRPGAGREQGLAVALTGEADLVAYVDPP